MMVQRSVAALVLMAAAAVAQTASPSGPGVVPCSNHKTASSCVNSRVLGGYTSCYWHSGSCYNTFDAWDVDDALAAWLVAVIVIGTIICLSVVACVLIGCFCWNNQNGRKTVVVMQQQPPPMQPVMGTYAYHNNGATVGVPASSAPLPYQTPYPQQQQQQQGQYVPPPPHLGEQPPLQQVQPPLPSQEAKDASAPPMAQ
eukprot:Rhum_TRINITY_DN14259_c10_g1::Rhum_TRINITY_DN14259_c10_g1_i1::g.77996::m.77996